MMIPPRYRRTARQALHLYRRKLLSVSLCSVLCLATTITSWSLGLVVTPVPVAQATTAAHSAASRLLVPAAIVTPTATTGGSIPTPTTIPPIATATIPNVAPSATIQAQPTATTLSVATATAAPANSPTALVATATNVAATATSMIATATPVPATATSAAATTTATNMAATTTATSAAATSTGVATPTVTATSMVSPTTSATALASSTTSPTVTATITTSATPTTTTTAQATATVSPIAGQLFGDGFESGGLTARTIPTGLWSSSSTGQGGESLSVVTSASGGQVHSGFNSLQVTKAGLAGAMQVVENFTSQGVIDYRYYFYLPANWNPGTGLRWQLSLATALANGVISVPGQTSIDVDGTGTVGFRYFDGSAVLHTLVTQTVSLGQWHYVEIAETISNPAGSDSLSASLDGQVLKSMGSLDLGTQPISSLRIGATNASGVNGTVYFDDVAIGSAPLGSTAPVGVAMISAPSLIGVNQPSPAITVTLVDAAGVPAQAGPAGFTYAVSSTSATGNFAATSAFTASQQTLSFAPFSHTATVFYRDSKPGKPLLTVQAGSSMTSAQVTIIPAASQLVVAAPGQTFTSGSGVTGTPLPESLSVPFSVTVYAVNSTGAIDPSANQTVTLQSSDPATTLPPSLPLSGGIVTVTVMPGSLQPINLTATAALISGTVTTTSSAIPVTFVPNGDFSHGIDATGQPLGWSFSSAQGLISETVQSGAACVPQGGVTFGASAPANCVQINGAAQVPNPTTPPTLSTSPGSGTTLTPGYYSYSYAWGLSASSLTLPSPPAWIYVAAGQQVAISVPTMPGNATGFQIYRSRPMTSTLFPAVGQIVPSGWMTSGTSAVDPATAGMNTVVPILYNNTGDTGTLRATTPITVDTSKPISLTFLALGTINLVSFKLSVPLSGLRPTSVNYQINQTFAQWTPVTVVITQGQYAGNTQIDPTIQVGPSAETTNKTAASIANISLAYYTPHTISPTGINYKGMNQGDVVDSCGGSNAWTWARSGLANRALNGWDPNAVAAQITSIHDTYGIRLIRVHLGIDQLFDAWSSTTGYKPSSFNTSTALDMGTDGTHSWNSNAIANFQTYLNDLPADTQLEVVLFREAFPQPTNPNVLPGDPQSSAFRPQALDGLHAQMRANYLQAAYDFINRFKSDPHIKIWDLFNEYPNVPNSYVPAFAIRSFLSALYQMVKPIVPLGQYVTQDTTINANVPTIPEALGQYYQWYAGMSDLYDVHMYSDTPALVDFSFLPVPVVLGEAGAASLNDPILGPAAYKYYYSNGQPDNVAAVIGYFFAAIQVTKVQCPNIFTLQPAGQWIASYQPAVLQTGQLPNANNTPPAGQYVPPTPAKQVPVALWLALLLSTLLGLALSGLGWDRLRKAGHP